MAGALAAQRPAALAQFLQHIAVADLGAHELDALALQRQFDRHIGHQRADHAGNAVSTGDAVLHDRIQQLVAVVEPAVGVDHLQAVGIAVEGQPEVRAVGLDRLDQLVGRGGAIAVVDIAAIGLVADRHHVGAQLVEHVRGDVVGGAMRAVDHQLQAVQVAVVREGALAELDVAARRVVDPARAPQLFGRHAMHRRLELGLDRQFDLVRQLVAGGREELDAVVVVWIVAGRDHHAGGQPQRAGQIGHTGRRQRAGQQHMDAGRGKARFQRGFQHIAGDPRVLADQHRGLALRARLAKRQHAPRRIAEPHHEVRRDRRLADPAAHAIGAEVFACHPIVLPVLIRVRSVWVVSYGGRDWSPGSPWRHQAAASARCCRTAHQVLIASTDACTSCTRTI